MKLVCIVYLLRNLNITFNSFKHFVCFFLLQNKVIAIPKEFYVDTVIGDIASSLFQFKCNIDDNDMR